MSRVPELLTELAGSLLPPKGADANTVAASIPRLRRLLREYAEPIAVRALEDWPRSSRYFPLESDLVDALNRARKIHRAKDDTPVKGFDDGMQDEPVGATLDFIKEFRRINATKCAAFFDPPAVIRWSHNRIGTRIAWTAEAVERHAPGLLAKHDVRIVEPLRFHIRRPRHKGDEGFDIEWRWS